MKHFYQGRRVLVTGGQGFIGSNLALRLAALGARVTAVDSRVSGCGSNAFNLQNAPANLDSLDLCIADRAIESRVRDASVIFNLAGEISHTHSMLYPERDLEINAANQLAFLRICTRVAPGVRIVYAGTRQVYGAPQALPVDEAHPISPVDYNGVHKAAAAQYHLMLTRLGQLDAVVLRLTNIYGPRMAIGLGCQGVLPAFTRAAIEGRPMEVFGDGMQLRDPVFVDDACEAFLRAGMAERLPQRTLNVGSPEAHTMLDIAREFARQGGLSEPALRPFPADRRPIDIGSYATCISTCAEQLDWRATTSLADGLRVTLDYFRRHRGRYLGPEHDCPLPHRAASAT